MKYKKSTKVHFMGIGGSGVSSLAAILHEKGLIISGCDQIESPFTAKLRKEGVQVEMGHDSNHLNEQDLIIYTSAIKDTEDEKVEAEKKGIELLSYPEAMGQLTKEIKTISVCGTHGKTTTTAFTYFAFKYGDTKPAIVVGSTIPQLNNINGTFGDGQLLIMEACEYRRHFLEYSPHTILITNLDIDHLDYYKDQTDYNNAYMEFIKKLPSGGLLIINGEDQNIKAVLPEVKKSDLKFFTFGIDGDYDFKLINNTVCYRNEKIGQLELQLSGRHNQMNALGAFAVAYLHGIKPESALKGLSEFAGTGRRMELIGEQEGTLIYDDYAHHPTEIKATLSALRGKFGQDKKILCIFQPHQQSRTEKLFDQFLTSFKDADTVIISDIYEARDSHLNNPAINSKSLAEQISQKHPDTSYGGSIDQILTTLRTKQPDTDIIITLGAGDIWQLSHQLADI